jgi:polysaccharide biosynthesis/export protein
MIRKIKTNSKIHFQQLSLLSILLLVLFSHLYGQEAEKEYVIGPGDLLAITFWQKPEYNIETFVNANGRIELPLIGSMQASGATPSDLRKKIEERISLLDASLTAVAVIVQTYGSKTVYMTGAVLQPGKMNFEVIPNLWQVILEAGGPLPTAQLDDVTIVRGGPENAGELLHVNLAEALEKGELSSLPSIYPNDTIHVLNGLAGAGGAEGGLGNSGLSTSPLERRNIAYIYGAVARPGVFTFTKGMHIIDAIVQAGGLTENAKLDQIQIYFNSGNQSEMAVFNMKRYIEDATPIPLKLNSGDTIYIPETNRRFLVLEYLDILLYVSASIIIARW